MLWVEKALEVAHHTGGRRQSLQMFCQRVTRLQEGKAYDAHNKPIPLAGEHKQAELQDARTAEDMWKSHWGGQLGGGAYSERCPARAHHGGHAAYPGKLRSPKPYQGFAGYILVGGTVLTGVLPQRRILQAECTRSLDEA